MSKKKDLLLKLFLDITKSDRLHLGYWESDDKAIWEQLPAAQINYSNHIFAKIPAGTKTILDVGCGTGTDTIRLHDLGYTVEGIIPDVLLKEEIEKKYGSQLKIHYSKFEDLVLSHRYDLILLMESYQYLNADLAFEQFQRLLNPEGYVLLSDFFRIVESNDYKEWCILDHFLAKVKQHQFTVEYCEDITEHVLPTIELAGWAYHQYVLPISETLAQAGIQAIQRKRIYSVFWRLIKYLLRKDLSHLAKGIYEKIPRLLDRENFRRKAKYMIFRLRKM